MKKDDLKGDLLEQIAKKHCSVSTLATRNSDGLDFHDISVWSLKAALEAAFDAGMEHQKMKSQEKPSLLAGLREQREGQSPGTGTPKPAKSEPEH